MNRISVTDRDGWRKEFTVERSIIYIGSDPANDIVLDRTRGGGVAPRHLQLLSLTSNAGGWQLVNLGSVDIMLGADSQRALPPLGSSALQDGEQVQLADFTLKFSHLEPGSVPQATSPVSALMSAAGSPLALNAPLEDRPAEAESMTTGIALRLALPSRRLAPDHALEGTITVRNHGNSPSAQFRVMVEGLDPSWYEIGLSPVLAANVEKDIPLHIFHPKRPNPPAGGLRFTVRASAPEAYPREVASVTQSINILPYYSHRLRWLSTI